jgi:pimeloyl-ACP methyl ester carboxylesterase
MPFMSVQVQTRGEGRPVVVLPSFSLDHNAMAEVVEPVFAATTGWSRLYVDLPGTGASPPGEPRSDAVLDDVVHTIDSMLGDQRFLVAGWSYGGYLAAGLARRLPPRIGGLLMMCTGFKIRPHDRNLAGVLPSDAEPGWLADVPANLHDHFAHAIGCQTAAVAQRVAAVLARNGPTDEPYLAALRTDGFALSDEDVPTPCSAPVSILTGRRDRVAGYADLLSALGHYDHADYLTISNAGHYLPLEQPRLFEAAALSWLDECQLLLADAPRQIRATTVRAPARGRSHGLA